MQGSLFNLSFANWPLFLLFIIPALINAALCVYIYIVLPSNKTNRALAVFLLLLVIEQTIDGCLRMSATFETATAWTKLYAAPLAFLMPFEILFIIRYAQWYKSINNLWFLTLLFLPAIAIELAIIAGLAKLTPIKSELWGWVTSPQDTLVTNAMYLWNVILTFVATGMYWVYYYSVRKNKEESKPALLIALGNLVPVIAGIIGQAILPILLKADDIPITTPAITVFSIALFMAVTKYKVLRFSPKYQWNTILENMSEGVLIVNTKIEIMYANVALCKLVGYEFSELKGLSAENLFIEDEGDKQKSTQAITDRQQGKQGQYEVRFTTKTGKKIWVSINGSPYYDTKGNITGSIATVTNVDELKSVNKELELFIYKASHDLRGPLASVLGLATLAKEETNMVETANYLDMIDVSAKKLDAILVALVHSLQIKDVNEFSDEIHIEELLNDILKRFQGYDGFATLAIIATFGGNGVVCSSRLILESICQNMVENAIKYQKQGISNAYLNISATHTENSIELVFEDNGIGISDLIIDKIFDMYFRGSSKGKGTGLGLYLVKHGVEKLNGSIQVESEKGKGTKFMITLPTQPTT